MGTQPSWRLRPCAGLAALELVASEDPSLLPFPVEGLADSLARPDVHFAEMERLPLFRSRSSRLALSSPASRGPHKQEVGR